ncbi:helix-turn-helix domain-containing protein [Brochothrix campestris]|uniref:MerR family transcriptional regulator n=2 Tax=Brochothrix campestris TaxID=2757 RepID=W7CLH3_9LIST|nr:MerR family transcriptional regulator [Brochothrix campestris]EUJ36721.1 MerR family transcriptional regulator [Brochothrix campestris FSL F6-1037]
MKNIGQISKKYGISTRTLRYYEEENLIKSVKKQQRFYCESEVERIERIIYLRKHKFTIKEIKDILLHPLFIDDLLKYIYIRRLKTKIATLEMELEKLTEEISKENICGIDTSQMSSNILEDLNSDENAIALNKRFF